jgi:protein Mpv17
MLFTSTTSGINRLLSSKYAAPTTVTLGSALAFATCSLSGQASKKTVCSYSTAAVQSLGTHRLLSTYKPCVTPTLSNVKGSLVRSTPFTTKAAAETKSGFLAWYEGHLEARPVLTKMVTGSILWGLGDAVGQTVPQLIFGDSSETATQKPYDYARTGRAVFYGFAIHAPCSHLHYNFLEWMTVKGGFTGLGIPVFKAFMEQFVYWSWVSNALYHGAMGAMQNMTFQQIYDRIADVLWETQKAQWVFWIPVQLLNFRFVPVRHQLNVVLITSVAWTALLSVWYPPEEEGKEDVKKSD